MYLIFFKTKVISFQIFPYDVYSEYEIGSSCSHFFSRCGWYETHRQTTLRPTGKNTIFFDWTDLKTCKNCGNLIFKIVPQKAILSVLMVRESKKERNQIDQEIDTCGEKIVLNWIVFKGKFFELPKRTL